LTGEDPEVWCAAKKDDVDELKTLLEENVDILEKTPPMGWTALHIAAGHGALNVAQFLLDSKADVDSAASDGETPLHLAAQEGCAESIQFLTEKGALVNARNDDDETPLHIAVQHIGSKAADHIVALLEARSDLTAKDSSGQTAAQQARILTNRGDELCKLLKDEDAESPGTDQLIHQICKHGDTNLLKEALQWTSNVQEAAQRSLIPGAAGGHTEVMETLINARADPLKVTEEPILVGAADGGKTKMVRWLLARGLDPKVPSKDGVTALMAASLRGADDAVKILLEANSDVDHLAHANWTALMVACQGGHISVARTLLDAKATLDLANDDGATAKDLAIANSHTGVVKALETRAKLDARRAKTEVSKSGPSEDARDLEQLLAGLGEPTAKGGKKSKKKKAVAQGEAGSAPEALEPPKKAPPAPKAPSKDTKEVVTPAQATDSKSKKSGTKKKDAETLPQQTVRSMQSRLQEISRQRAALDVEETDIRRQLTEA